MLKLYFDCWLLANFDYYNYMLCVRLLYRRIGLNVCLLVNCLKCFIIPFESMCIVIMEECGEDNCYYGNTNLQKHVKAFNFSLTGVSFPCIINLFFTFSVTIQELQNKNHFINIYSKKNKQHKNNTTFIRDI